MTKSDPDGLRLPIQAKLADLAVDEILQTFAAGLIPKALSYTPLTLTLNEALFQTVPAANPLLTALLALDADVEGRVAQKRRITPLPGFLSYRTSLSPDKFPLTTLRLPPLNPDGHFFFTPTDEAAYAAVRLDLHPTLQVLGHVRLALSRQAQPPIRLQAVEHRLDRQILTEAILTEALALSAEDLTSPLTEKEQTSFIKILRSLIDG